MKLVIIFKYYFFILIKHVNNVYFYFFRKGNGMPPYGTYNSEGNLMS